MRKRAIGCLLGSILALIGFGILLTAPAWFTDRIEALHPGCLYRVSTQAPVVALTIDDGPDSISTPLILAELELEKARATFFLISDRIQGQEKLVGEIVRRGHELGNHFTTDRPSIGLSAQEFETDLLQAHRILTRYGRPRWARPGSGWYSRKMIGILERHGYRCALGSVYPFDAAIPAPHFSVEYILRRTAPGAVLILHDGGGRGRRTAQVLRVVLPELRRRGYRVVTLSELTYQR
jgi:peptidoglycan-N-acetylglucosamine deacetylase